MSDIKQNIIDRALKDKSIADFNISRQEIEEHIIDIVKILKVQDLCNLNPDKSTCAAGGHHFRLSKNAAGIIEMTSFICPKCAVTKTYLIEQNYLYTSINIKNHRQLLNPECIIIKPGADQKNRIRLINYFIQVKKQKIQPLGIYIQGSLNTGKTYLIIALCNELALLNQKIAYVVMSNFYLDFLKTARNSDERNDLVDMLKRADVLILDELGTEEYKPFVHQELILPIINYRFSMNKLTIFTSRYSLAELDKYYKIGGASLKKVGMYGNSRLLIESITKIVGTNLFVLDVTM